MEAERKVPVDPKFFVPCDYKGCSERATVMFPNGEATSFACDAHDDLVVYRITYVVSIQRRSDGDLNAEKHEAIAAQTKPDMIEALVDDEWVEVTRPK